MRASVAISTNASYNSGWNQWAKHRAALGKAAEGDLKHPGLYEPSEQELMDFVAELSMERKGKAKGLTDRTVRSYLAAISHHHLIEGHEDPRLDLCRLPKMLIGVRRLRGATSKAKRPVTLSLLKEMRKHVQKESLASKAMWAAMCMGLHGLFRLGELLPPPREKRALTWGHVRKVSEGHVTVLLGTSKTDQFGKGAFVNLFATGDETCPIAALRALRSAQEAEGVRIKESTPLFTHSKHARAMPLSKAAVISALKRAVASVAKEFPHLGLQSKDFAGHSLRRGGATTLALRGVREPVLRLLGRWESDAVNLYIALPVESLKDASELMTLNPERFKALDLAAAATPTSVEQWVNEL